MTTLAVGGHGDQVRTRSPRRSPATPGLVQVFLSDPRLEGPGLPGRRAARGAPGGRAAAGLDLYVHAPYVINVASTNNRIRIPSRKLLQQYLDGAARSAQGVVVHGGHVTARTTSRQGRRQLAKAIDALETTFPCSSRTRRAGTTRWRAVWSGSRAVGGRQPANGGDNVGFTLDTCHAWAGGARPRGAADQVGAITGRIDLVHANDSRDAPGSGADRHANLGAGQVDPDELVAAVRDAGAPVVVEKPGRGGGPVGGPRLAQGERLKPAPVTRKPAIHDQTGS